MNEPAKKFFVPPAEKTHEIPESDVPRDPGRILLLDDDPDLSYTLQEFLLHNGYRVTVVTNGVEGVKQVMAEDFDVILCDMLMPNLPGDMFYLAVERTKPHLCKRFIFISGHKGEPRIDAFIRKVRGLLLWKPFQPYELLEHIKLIEKKNRAGDAPKAPAPERHPPASSPKQPPPAGQPPEPGQKSGTTFFIHT